MKTLCRNAMLFAATALSLGSLAQPANQVRPLTVDDAFSTNEFLINGGPATFSPDSSQLAYVVCDHKRREEAPRDRVTVLVATLGSAMYTLGCDIWVSPTDGGPGRNVSGASGNNWAPAWSPDGAQLAFLSDRDGAAKLYVWNARTGAVRKLGDEVVRTFIGAERPQWAPDGKHILVRLRPPGMQDEDLFHEKSMPPREAVPAKKASQGPTVVVHLAGAADKSAAGAAQTSAGTQEGMSSRKDLPKELIADIALVSVESGTARRLVERAMASHVELAPNGRSLIYTQWKSGPEYGASVAKYELVRVDLASGTRQVLVPELRMFNVSSNALSWSPDSRWIAYFGATSAEQMSNLKVGSGSSSHSDLFVVSASGGVPARCLPAHEIVGFDSDFTRPLWSPQSDAFYAIADNQVWRGSPQTRRCTPLAQEPHVEIRSLVPAGNGGTVWTPDGSLAVVVARDVRTKSDGFYSVSRNGQLRKQLEQRKRYGSGEVTIASSDGAKLAFPAQSASEPEDMWITTAAFDPPTRVTRLNPHLDEYIFGASRLIGFRNADGKELQASLLLPADYEPGKRYPMIVLVYASMPGSRNVNTFGLVNMGQYNYQMLATRGYAVLNPDIPVNIGTPMQDLVKSVLPAVDAAVHLGIADPDRLGVTGQSNGGYSTLALIAQTQRFKAAVMNAGFGDLTAFHGTWGGAWIPWLERLGGAMGLAPWENPQRYVQNSPVYYLDRITTPLIIQAGVLDSGIVPYSDQVFVGLKRLGKDVTYLRYEDEGHLLEIPANKVDYWERTLEFWDQRLKGK